MFFTKIIQV